MTFLSFDNHFETKVLFLMYFGSQVINEYYVDAPGIRTYRHAHEYKRIAAFFFQQ